MSLSWAEGGISPRASPCLSSQCGRVPTAGQGWAMRAGQPRAEVPQRPVLPPEGRESLPVSVLGWCSARIGQGDCGHSGRDICSQLSS